MCNTNLDCEIFLQLKALNEKIKQQSSCHQQLVDGWHSISFNHSIPIDNNPEKRVLLPPPSLFFKSNCAVKKKKKNLNTVRTAVAVAIQHTRTEKLEIKELYCTENVPSSFPFSGGKNREWGSSS